MERLMSTALYNVVFNGKIAEATSAAAVTSKLAAIFKIGEDKAAAMMSGKTIYIKKSVDEATAKKYQAVLANAGAIAQLVAVNTEAPASTAPAAPASQAAPSAQPQSSPAQQGQQAQQPVSSSKIPLPGHSATSPVPDKAAPGTSVAKPIPQSSSLDGISLAAPGTELLINSTETAEPDIDLSGITLAENDNTPLSGNKPQKTLEIDTKGLSLEN